MFREDTGDFPSIYLSAPIHQIFILDFFQETYLSTSNNIEAFKPSSLTMASPNVITTTHDSTGLSVFSAAPVFHALTPKVGIIYSTASSSPVSFKDDADLVAHDGRTAAAGLIPTAGSVLASVEFPPGATDTYSRMHRTETLDLGVVVAGEGMWAVHFS